MTLLDAVFVSYVARAHPPVLKKDLYSLLDNVDWRPSPEWQDGVVHHVVNAQGFCSADGAYTKRFLKVFVDMAERYNYEPSEVLLEAYIDRLNVDESTSGTITVAYPLSKVSSVEDVAAAVSAVADWNDDEQVATLLSTCTLGCASSAEFVVIQQEKLYASLGETVWPSAHVLTEYIAHHRDEYDGRRLLELGAGCGLVGIAAKKLTRCVSVTLTDYITDVLLLAKRNVALNNLEECEVTSSLLDWENDSDEAVIGTAAVHDCAIGADVVYSPETAVLVLRVLPLLLCAERSSIQFVILALSKRVDSTLETFLAGCSDAGLNCASEEPGPEFMHLSQDVRGGVKLFRVTSAATTSST